MEWSKTQTQWGVRRRRPPHWDTAEGGACVFWLCYIINIYWYFLYSLYPGVLRTDRRAGCFLCGGMSHRGRNSWIEWVKITKKLCSQYNIATDRKFSECNIFDAKSMRSDALAPTKPIQSASLEPSWPKIAPNIGLLWLFVDLGCHIGGWKL